MREPFVAEAALERLVPGVDSDVFLQRDGRLLRRTIFGQRSQCQLTFR